jgi:hypothetical protein
LSVHVIDDKRIKTLIGGIDGRAARRNFLQAVHRGELRVGDDEAREAGADRNNIL